jgi:ADP-heptose:LPS heptosyltransferase
MIPYYIHKFIQSGFSFSLAILLPRTRWKNWILSFKPKKFEFKNQVVLGFWDKQLFHLGDQLFHIGLIRSLQAKGVEVIICGDTPLKPFFKRMNVSFVAKEKLKEIEGALVISKDDIFFSHLLKNKHDAFLGVNYRFTKNKKRIGEILFEETQKMLEGLGINIEMKKEFWDVTKAIPPAEKNFELPTNSLLYHDFVVSGALRAYQRLETIFDLGRKLAKTGQKIVYVGNKKQKRQRPRPDFVSLDMRGESGIMDLFTLVKNENVNGVITYDTLLAHIGNLQNKKCFVVNKHETKQAKIWDRFVPMSEHIEGEMEKY